MFCKNHVKARASRVRAGKFSAGFSLIELMVVLGVIVILATIVTPQVRRAMDNAKAQTCRNNLKQLHAAVLSFAADHGGNLPVAQTFETHNTRTREYYTEGESGEYQSAGWVAWVPKDKSYKSEKLQSTYYKESKTKNARLQSHAAEFRDDLGIGPDARFAVENGALFDYVGDMSVYVCPLIRAALAKAEEFGPDSGAATTADGGNIYRTYAMNAFFRCSQRPSWERLTSKIGVSYKYGGHVPEASKLLLFSAVQPSAEEPPARSGRQDPARKGKWSHDGCLNPDKWNSSEETIYCAHPGKKTRGPVADPKTGKTKYDWLPCALAVFYDGHVETVESTIGKGNVAWFLNRGWTPGDSLPDGADAND